MPILALIAALTPHTLAAELTVVDGQTRVDGQPVASALTVADRVYVLTAGGELQIWAAGATPALLSTRAVPGADHLFVADGRVWVEQHEVRATPVDAAAAPLALPAPAEGTPVTSAAPSTAPTARVLRVDRGVALIDRGSDDGLQVSDNVRMLGTRSVKVPSLDGPGEELRDVERVVATGRVRIVEPHRALIDLARGGRVSEGDRVEVRDGAYRYPVAPERLRGFREVGATVRPLLALDTVGVAMVDEAWLTVGFEDPWYATARLAPVGIGWSKDGNPLSVAGLASGGYDSRYFSVGLGAGWSMLNTDMGGSAQYDATAVVEPNFKSVDSAFAFVQEARLGARDGLHVGVRSTLLLVPTYTYSDTYDPETGDYLSTQVVDDGRNFVFGGIAMDLAVPTGDRADLVVDFGTGRAGATWVEGGLSAWLRGNGDKGSIGLQVGAGYASIAGSPENQYVQLYGPMVSAGARYRF